MELTYEPSSMAGMQSEARPMHLSLPRARPIDVDFTDVTYTVKTSRNCDKRILHGVSGSFRSGELTAIMGPSGAGKSTLLNLISGFQSEGMGGSVRTNGVPRDMAVFRKSSCYILQYDQLHPLFTVTEVLHMAASLKFGPGMARKARQIAVENVIDALGLSSCRDTRASNLSGGQQKRLSIALELLDNPPVMFLDEPTTGLDSSSCSSCVELLVKLAQGGRTIVCTLHQPSAREFEMIDHVYVMAAGWCIFQGDSRQAVPFLNSVQLYCPKYHNPADFLLEAATSETEDVLIRLETASSEDLERWRRPRRLPPNTQTLSSITGETSSMIMRAQKQGVSEWSKFCILLRRSCLQFSRDWTLTHLRLGLHVVVSILLGLLYSGAGQDGSRSVSNLSFCLVTIVYLAYTAMMPAVLKFPAEMYVLRKERFNNWYSLRTYYSAFTVADTPLQVLFCTVYVSIAYFMSSQASELFRFSKFLLACLLVSLLAESIGLLLGASVNQTHGTFIGAYSTALWIVLSGFLLIYEHTPVYLRWTHFISYLHYGFEALAVSLYGYDRGTLMCPDDTYCHYKYPRKMLLEIGINENNYWLDILVLAIVIIILRAFTYWVLRRRLNSLVC